MPRFVTDANVAGTEKLAVCSLEKVGKMAGSEPRLWRCDSDDVDAPKGLASPMSVFNIKGWSRSLAATAVMRCAYEDEGFRKAGLLIITFRFHFGRRSRTKSSSATLRQIISDLNSIFQFQFLVPRILRSFRTVYATCQPPENEQDLVSTNRGGANIRWQGHVSD